MSSSGIPFPHSIPKGLTEQPVLSHGGFGTHRDRVEAPAVPRAWGLAQYHQDKVPQHLRILSASLWGCVGANLKQAFHHTACKMGILIKGIESQSCTSIIPGEWGSGKTKNQARNFSISLISKISSTQEQPVATNGMKAQSCAMQGDNSLNCQWMDVPGADLYSAFTLLLYKEEMRVTERKDPAKEWKRSQPWLAMINPAP